MIFAAVLGLLTSFFMEVYSTSQNRKREIVKLMSYFHWRAVPEKTRKNIRRYFHFIWEESHGMDDFEKKVMQKLKGPLRAKLAHTIYGSLLKDSPFLKWMREYPTCIMELSLHCTTVFYEESNLLFQAGSLMHSLYFLQVGKVQIHHVKGARQDVTTTGGMLSMRRDIRAKLPKRRGDAAAAIAAFATVLRTVRQDDAEASDVDPAQGMWLYAQREVLNVGAMENLATEQSVTSPAYFGESCLWNMEEACFSQYTAIAGSRIEVVVLPKAGIDEVLKCNPALLERFDAFRRCVRRLGLQKDVRDHHPLAIQFTRVVGKRMMKQLSEKTENEEGKGSPTRRVGFNIQNQNSKSSSHS